MRIWNLDAHAAVITDVKKQLGEIGHSVDSWNLTGHYWTQGLPQRTNWRGFKTDFIWDYGPEKCLEEHGEHLKQYDANLVCYPPLMIRLFDLIDKPMISYLPVRYDLWTSDHEERWHSWQEWFCKRVKEGRLHVAANSLYDVEYCYYFTGIRPEYIPSMCDYSTVQYAPDGRGPLLMDTRSEDLTSTFIGEAPGLQNIRRTYGRYDWETIAKHKCFIWVPYNASIMSFFEHYTYNVPILVPTKEFMLELKHKWGAIGEITHRQCSNHYPPGSWGKGIYDAPDPNQYNDPVSLRHWMNYWDMYCFPHVQYFGCFNELREKLEKTDWMAVSQQMKTFNASRKVEIGRKWDAFIRKVQAGV